MTQSSSLSVKACAKINLGLEITGKRDDGFHELVTIFQTVDLADELTVSLTDSGLQLSVSGDFPVPSDGSNLCLQAAEAYLQAAESEAGVSLHLLKRIPVGAGLGGGSSDAAAVLRALHRLIGAEVDLHALAAKLGSDVPFFLHSGTTLGEGRGERLTPCPTLTTGHIVLAKPQLSISTREAYSLLEPADFSDGSRTRQLFDYGCSGEQLLDRSYLITNGFMYRLEKRWPELLRLREAMMDMEARLAMLSGSGSCVFAVFPTPCSAGRCGDMLATKGYWHHVGNMVHCNPDDK